jgi:hypothetical protein
VANRLSLQVGVVRTRGGNTNTIFSAPIVIHRSVIDPDTAVPTPSILGTGVAAALKVAINTAMGFVRLDASARLPAVDGSQLTNLPGGGITDGDKGDITVSNSGATWTIDNDTITLAKLAHMPTARVLGRTTAGTGTPELLTISGTGSVAMTTSPTFATPNLDTPSVLVGTNISGTAANLTAGLVSSIGSLTGDVTSSNRATTLATVNSNVGSFTNASLTVNAKGLVTAASSGTAAVTSITGTANEITVTGTTTPTLSLPSALTFTGKTITGGTFNAAQLRADTTSDTAVTGESSTDGTGVGGRTVSGTALSGSATGSGTALSGYSASGKLLSLSGDDGENVVIANNGQLTLGNGASGTIVLKGSTSGSATITVSATGVLALPTGTTAPNLTLSATTSLLLGTAGSAVGNIGFRNADSGTTTVAPATGALGTGTVTLPLSGTLATLAGTETLTNKSIVATQLTGTIADARNTVSNSTTTTMSALTTIGGLTTVTGTGAMSLTGGAGDMTITSGTGNSRTLTLRTTTAGGVATAALTIGASQSVVITGGLDCGNSANGAPRFTTSSIGFVNRSFTITCDAVNITRFSWADTTTTLFGTSASQHAIFSGNVTASGTLITTPEALAPALNAGAACGVTTVATGFALNGVNALTLANGTNGQIKTIVCTAVTAAGTATLTPTTANGFTTVAFTAAGQTLTLQYFTTGGWVILSVRGATPA